jgi:hypothetical protein
VTRAGALPLALLLLSACGPSSEDIYSGELPERVDFNFHVKPILSDRCFACHGPDEAARKADLRLDVEAGARTVVRAGSLRRSELFRRILSDEPDERMPPPDSHLSLSDYEKGILARWIEQGAEWRPHWSYVAPTKPVPPEVADSGWAREAIDRFILQRLAREGLQPSREADRARLIRRVTFDLTGLPPTPEEVDRFLADPSPDAYESVVDRLLASPAYGERMATDWLDLARYSDSHGYQDDGIRYMWPWRDWVIEAFNQNQPYDEFVTWQLAGDLLPDATREQILATGFNRNHAQSAEGGIVDEEYRVEYVADRVQTLGRGLLGLSTDCARCHDHKFDPITQKDYFRLFAFFNNVDEIGLGAIDGNNGPVLLLPDDSTERRLKEARDEAVAAERALDRYRAGIAADSGFLRRAREARPDLARGLIGHFTFDAVDSVSGSGAVVPNHADPRHPGQFRGAPVLVPGIRSNALEVREGALARVREAYAFDRSDPFSFSLWVRPAKPLSRSAILVRALADNGGANRGWELNLHGDTVFVALMHVRSEDAIRVQTRSGIRMEAWTHLAVTYDGSARARGLKIWVDGELAPVFVLSDNLRRTIVPPSEGSGTPAVMQIGGKQVGSEVASFEGGRIDELRIYDRPLASVEVAALAGRDTTASTPDALAELYLLTRDAEYAKRAEALRRSIAEETRLRDGVDDVMVMRERVTPRPTHLLGRGVYDEPRERVEPGTPESVLPFPEELPRNRLGLARWLFDPANPLTARVAVNRYWQMLFGAGLVRTTDDFGSQGALPTHPELLDWLAVTYRESGWDTKAMLKRMVMSSTYRQASHLTPELRERDPENRLLSRGPGHRLPAEMIRDGALAASGLLVHEVGGPSVKPYQPEGLWEEKSAGQGRGALISYVQDHGESLYRRSLYTFQKRTSPLPMLVSFDASERAVCTVRRQQTNTPLQALTLLNDPQFVEASRLLAERMIRDGGATAEERLRFGFRVVTARHPSARELELLTSLRDRQLTRFRDSSPAARRLLSTGEMPRDASLDAVEVAAYTVVANALLNLDETLSKR